MSSHHDAKDERTTLAKLQQHHETITATIRHRLRAIPTETIKRMAHELARHADEFDQRGRTYEAIASQCAIAFITGEMLRRAEDAHASGERIA